MDEPASALDPIATQRIEELIYQLKTDYTIVIVTHNMQQAARVSDITAFFWLGKLVGVRTDRSHLHEPGRETDRGLRHRQVRIEQSSVSVAGRQSLEARKGAPAGAERAWGPRERRR